MKKINVAIPDLIDYSLSKIGQNEVLQNNILYGMDLLRQQMELKLLLVNIFQRLLTFDALFTQTLALVSRALKVTNTLHFPDTDVESNMGEASLSWKKKITCTLSQSTIIFTKTCNGNSIINT